MPSQTIIRRETTADHHSIHQLLASAFDTSAEADLVDSLRGTGNLAAWVAEQADRVVGFIGFSPVTVAVRSCNALGLAPLAVDPTLQRSGVGSKLMQHAIDHLQSTSVSMIVVLGDPAYYARFGFRPASEWHLRDEYGGGPAFQAIVIDREAFPAEGGLVRYGAEFAVFGG